MSRVKPGNKYVNMPKRDPSETNPTKIKRIHSDKEDYRKANTLSAWLFMKYDMSYKQYRNKSKNRREELRKEYEADTGHIVGRNYTWCNEDGWGEDWAKDALYEIGVPFGENGEPLGIGWDD